jgi:hypothetical protein
VRRAFETVRLMHTETMNRSRGMARHDVQGGRRLDPIMAASLVDSVAEHRPHAPPRSPISSRCGSGCRPPPLCGTRPALSGIASSGTAL